MKYTSKYLMKRLFDDYTRPRLKTLITAMFFMLVFAATQWWQLDIINAVYQKVSNHEHLDYKRLLPLQIIMLTVVTAVSGYLSTVTMSEAAFGIVNAMQKDLFNHIINSDLELHYKKTSGEFTSRIVNDIGMVKAAVTDVVVVCVKQSFSIIFIVGWMIYHDWRVLTLFITVAIIVVYPINRVAKRLRKLAKIGQEINASLTSTLSESFKGIRVVKAYNAEAFEKARTDSLMDKALRTRLKSIRVSNINNPMFAILTGIAAAGVIWYIGHTPDRAKQAAVVTIMIGLNKLFRPIKSMGGLSNTLQNALAASERFYTVMDTPAKIINRADAAKLEVKGGEIRLENLSFKYDSTQAEQYALENINILIPAGKKVALVGHSGSGKSTVINLILRFFDPQSGQISIDKQDIREIDIRSLRNNISLVTQDVFLFDDTIAANIAYGSGEHNREEIKNAAKVAMADNFITSFPGGYETRVGENGLRLSGGQKQRISIARAVLRNAPILLLDEATSSLDQVAEAEFHAALDNLSSGRTTLIVAHRLSTVINADLIYLIERGKIIASGTHEELLKNSENYRKLFHA